jgi:hypothetical protein
MSIELKNLYYHSNREIKEYKDIFLETDIGIIGVNVTCLDFVVVDNLNSMYRLNEIDALREKYGQLYIEEVRKTYDNDIYMLMSGMFILAIEYALNSDFEHSIQQFRTIEDIRYLNKQEFNDFKELDLLNLPHEDSSNKG